MTFPSFAKFFEAVTGDNPYAWQQSLADHLREHGRWPWHVDVPTGLGKTSCIDIAVYELARQAHGGGRRTAPQRIFHVVDRRTIIDSAVDHAQKLAQRIIGATSGPLVTVRTALSRLEPAGMDEVIHATGIHGDDPDDRQWMQRVTGCTIVSLTSHQFVSRLLLRGYGVSPGTRPVAAALCAIDRLVLFDEPHLSTQAVHTILATEQLQERAQEDLGLPRPSTVLLGATVPSYLKRLGTTAIRAESDRERDGAKERLHARRPVAVDWVAGTDSATSNALVAAAHRLVKSGAERTVVFANTVGMAQEVYAALSRKLESSGSTVPVRLATSRFRSWDKPQKKDLEGPGVVVTTQTLEVGVDLSFDALVTELCPWSSLLQRVGRFNRYGEFNADENFEQRNAVIVAGWDAKRGEPLSRKASGRVYSTESLDACARLLRDLADESDVGVIDMSPGCLKGIAADESALEPEQSRVGTLTSAMLPLMAQTRPTPEADIPVDALISGPDAEAPDDVELVWRDHLDVFDIDGVRPSVSRAEIVSVPRSAWAVFLAKDGKPTENLHDVEAAVELASAIPHVEDLRLYRAWDRTEGTWVVPSTSGQLVRSSRVIMSSALGGYTPELGWTGSHARESDLDISWDAALIDLGRQCPGQIVDLIIRHERFTGDAPDNAPDAVGELIEAFHDVHDQLSDGGPREEVDVDAVIEASRNYVRWRISTVTAAPEDEAARQPQAPSSPSDTVIGILMGSDPDVVIARVQLKPIRQGGPVPLDEHQAQVGTWAGIDATTTGLSTELIADITCAGAHHDDGKRHPAFQRYLGGDPSGSRPLAKSSWAPESAWADRRRRAEAGLPDGWRHDAESARRLLKGSALVRHLAGSHHGWFRPVLPPTRYDSYADRYPLPTEHADEFDLLNDRFGVWGLAYLESLVRMADWRASARPWDSPQVEVPTPKLPLASTSTVESSPVSGTEHSFPGLHSHPMTGWFAVVGLLAAASSTDPRARLHWKSLSSDATGTPLVPVLTTTDEPEQLVRRIIESASWQSALDRTNGVLTSGGLTAKGQKVGPASALHSLLETADEGQDWFLTGLLNDLASAESSSKIPLAMAPFANNASYVRVAFTCTSGREGVLPHAIAEAADALTMPTGFTRNKCDGGMDRDLEAKPGVNGLGDPVTRRSRSALAPLALYGMASLGTGPRRGVGVVAAGEVALPLPTTGQTFAQLRALTYLGRGRPRWDWTSAGLEWIYSAVQQSLTAYESVWNGRARPRGRGRRS